MTGQEADGLNERCTTCTLDSADTVTRKFIEGSLRYANHGLPGWPEDDLAKAQATDREEYLDAYGAEGLLAAQGCARMIDNGTCRPWYYDSDTRRIIAKHGGKE